jgi:hypothetical protein
MDLEISRDSFSQAFRAAREAGADYFLILSVNESERDLSLKGELFVGRTGSPAAQFSSFRTGADRLRNAARNVADQLAAALPFRGELIRRQQSRGLIDKGRLDGAKAGAVYEVVKKGSAQVRNEGIGLVYADDDVVGTLEIGEAGEELAEGALRRNGFFDRIAPGDEIFLKPEQREVRAVPETADPQLRALLRGLR